MVSSAVLGVTRYVITITFVVTKLANVTRYLSNEVTVTSLILHNIITLSNKVTNLVSNPLSNA